MLAIDSRSVKTSCAPGTRSCSTPSPTIQPVTRSPSLRISSVSTA